MDDFTPYGVTFEDALQNLEKVLKRCVEVHLALSTEKCHMMMNQRIVLGHFISFLGIQVNSAKILVIQTLPIPKTQTDVRSFLGHAGYYRRFIKNFSKIASPLFVLLTKNVEFKWTDDCEKAFNELKHQLSTAPILDLIGHYPFIYPLTPQILQLELSWVKKEIVFPMPFILSIRI